MGVKRNLPYRILLYDKQMNKVYEGDHNGGETSVSVSRLPEGLYYVRIVQGEKSITRMLLVDRK